MPVEVAPMISRRCKAPATCLVGKPAATATTIADDLDLRSAERHHLSPLLLMATPTLAAPSSWLRSVKSRPALLPTPSMRSSENRAASCDGSAVGLICLGS